MKFIFILSFFRQQFLSYSSKFKTRRPCIGYNWSFFIRQTPILCGLVFVVFGYPSCFTKPYLFNTIWSRFLAFFQRKNLHRRTFITKIFWWRLCRLSRKSSIWHSICSWIFNRQRSMKVQIIACCKNLTFWKVSWPAQAMLLFV